MKMERTEIPMLFKVSGLKCQLKLVRKIEMRTKYKDLTTSSNTVRKIRKTPNTGKLQHFGSLPLAGFEALVSHEWSL